MKVKYVLGARRFGNWDLTFGKEYNVKHKFEDGSVEVLDDDGDENLIARDEYEVVEK